MYNACRVNPAPDPDFPNYWEKVEEPFYRLCSKFSAGGRKCGEDYYCGNPIEYDISLRDDGAYGNFNILLGLASFDNFF